MGITRWINKAIYQIFLYGIAVIKYGPENVLCLPPYCDHICYPFCHCHNGNVDISSHTFRHDGCVDNPDTIGAMDSS